MPLRGRVAALAALLVIGLLAGCAPAVATGGDGEAAESVRLNYIEVGGVTRSYLVRTPIDAPENRPLPVLVVLHGAGGDALRAETATGFTGYGDADNFIVVYPNGTQAADIPGQLAWNAGACCGAPKRNEVDDVGFIAAVLDEVAARNTVDPERVYLAGFSNGGMLSYRLSCELGERFAGIAVVAGALNLTVCNAPVPMSVLVIHGTGDLTVPYDGGKTNERTAARFGQWRNVSVADSTAFWRDRDGCDRDPVTTIEEPTTTDIYENCLDDRLLEVVTIQDGTHIWPRTETLGYDASAAILQFFQLS